MKDLVVVESPTKAKTLAKFLGSKYEIMASMGHLVDLPKSKLGVDVENNFEPAYEPVKGKGDVVKKLKTAAKQATKVYLATDPDREGEAIAYHLQELMKGRGKGKFLRITFHEITQTAIEAAFEKPTAVNLALVDAQQARRVVDRLVGYQLSPVLWKKVRRGLSAGRVQSVALRLVVEREKAIKTYKPQEYWEIRVKLAVDKPKAELWVELVEVEGKKIGIKGEEKSKTKEGIYLDSKAVVEPIIEALKRADYEVEAVEQKERLVRPYPPYTTSTLQQAGANVLGYTGKQTMRLAQDLYEAGLITYHRTDSFNLATGAVAETRKLIGKQFGAEYLPDKPQFYKTRSKNAQEAHEAIRPTQMEAKLKADFSGKHQKLYDLIWKRMMSCQMLPAKFDATSILVAADKGETGEAKYRLKATGSIMRFAGWKKVYQNGEIQDETVELPELKSGQKLAYIDLAAEQKQTQPPPRYNDASLVRELERRGIGRPSTYAAIISTILFRGYIERIEKRLVPSALGETVAEFLVKYFAKIMDYDFTAEMEEDLDRIARAEKEWRAVMKQFYQPFNKNIRQVEKTAERAKVPTEATDQDCPECKQGKLVIRTGRFGKFLSCEKFPECKYTASLTQKLEGFACPKCGGEVVLKRTKRRRSFWGCANYPKCDYASWKDPRKVKP